MQFSEACCSIVDSNFRIKHPEVCKLLIKVINVHVEFCSRTFESIHVFYFEVNRPY